MLIVHLFIKPKFKSISENNKPCDLARLVFFIIY